MNGKGNPDRAVGAPIGDHLREAAVAAVSFVVCQVVAESTIVALRSRDYLLSPAFFQSQIYDFAVKIFQLVPGASDWFRGGALDRFLPEGFVPKLAVAAGILVPNLLVVGTAAGVIAALRFVLRRRACATAVVWTIALLGAAVHAVALARGVSVPKAWTLWVLARNAGRVFVWDGTAVSIVVFLAATGATLLLVRLRRRRRSAVALLAASAAALVLAALAPLRGSPAPAEARIAEEGGGNGQRAAVDNVILVSIDSLRADRLGCYGNERPTSPALDRLAAQGVRFTSAMSTASWTLPSHMSMLTGREVLSHGVINERTRLPRGIPTIAEMLGPAGIATGAVVSAELVLGHYGFARGFDQYDDKSLPAKTWFESLNDEKAPEVVKLAGEWLKKQGKSRFFLFLHFWDVHYDYVPPPPYDRMFDPDYEGKIDGSRFYQNKAINPRMARRDLEHVLALYDGEIRWVDEHIGRLIAMLDELGLSGRTAVIVTADHGDEFFEHGNKGHWRTLYREVLNVPLIMRVPGYPGGQVAGGAVSTVDIVPTVLDLMGVLAPAPLDGKSLLAAARGERGNENDAVYAWLCQRGRLSCMTMQHSAAGTLIHSFQPQRIEFYAPGDLRQEQNLAPTDAWPRHDELARLEGRLSSRWEAFRGQAGKQERVTLDAETQERLCALGYCN